MTVRGNAPDESRESKSRWLHLVFAALCVHGIAFTISLYVTPDEEKQGLRELCDLDDRLAIRTPTPLHLVG